jgi:hypothetical protein
MLAEVVDAVIGIDTHRDSHEVEIAEVTGTPIATMRISNDDRGFAALLASIAEVAPGPRVAVSLEGSRSYGIGLARAGPIRSTPTWPCWPHCAWTPTGSRRHAPMVTGRRCGFCSVHVRNSRRSARRKPTGCVPCCWPATTPTAGQPAAR